MTPRGPEPEEARRLRRRWEDLRRTPFPAPSAEDPRLQEVALYQSWLGSLVEQALGAGGRLSRAHLELMSVREREGNQSLWTVAAELGEPVRSYVARLIAIQDLLGSLPEAE